MTKLILRGKPGILKSVFLFCDLVKDAHTGIVHLFTVLITSAVKLNRRL